MNSSVGKKSVEAESRSSGRDGPDFICFGAQKGGTRWLFDQLDAHPGFWMPPIKELHYFNSPASRRHIAEKLARKSEDLEDFNRKRRHRQLRPLTKRDLRFVNLFLKLAEQPMNANKYARLFRGKGDLLSGDITPGYSALDEKRIGMMVDRFPDARYLFIARDPVRRFWSQIGMHIHKKRLTGKLTARQVKALLGRKNYRTRSYQAGTVELWRRMVPADRFRLYFFDDLVADPTDLRRRMLTFIGADPDAESQGLSADFNRKKGKSSLPMPDNVRAVLAECLADELRACARTLGGPAERWPELYGIGN